MTGPDFVASEVMMGWIDEIVSRGIRRPGYEADRWTEEFVHRQFRRFGLDQVRFEPLTCTYWEDHAAAVTVRSGDGSETATLDAFAVPASRPAAVEAPLARWDPAAPERVAGRIAVVPVEFMHLPATFPVAGVQAGRDGTGSSPAVADRVFDTTGGLATDLHRLPFGPQMQDTMEPAIDAGAAGFIGVLLGYPGGCRYYVPYDGRRRSIPGVYVSEATARRLEPYLSGHGTGRVTVEAELGTTTTRNVVGELPGADDEWVVVATHHDGPWASAVEDGSGIALVLAQAAAWASVATAERPHRLVFLASAAHMAGGAGTQAFIGDHRADMDRTVLEVHLEHAAVDAAGPGPPERDDQVVPRWWFCSEIPRLEATVGEAILRHGLDRSLLVPPDALGARPTTDGGFFHEVRVPLVNYLAAPWYLFDPADTLDKVDRPTLGALSRAAFDIVASTAGVSAAAMRSGVR